MSTILEEETAKLERVRHDTRALRHLFGRQVERLAVNADAVQSAAHALRLLGPSYAQRMHEDDAKRVARAIAALEVAEKCNEQAEEDPFG